MPLRSTATGGAGAFEFGGLSMSIARLSSGSPAGSDLPGLVKGCISAEAVSLGLASPVEALDSARLAVTDAVRAFAASAFFGSLSEQYQVVRDAADYADSTYTERSNLLRSFYGPGLPDSVVDAQYEAFAAARLSDSVSEAFGSEVAGVFRSVPVAAALRSSLDAAGDIAQLGLVSRDDRALLNPGRVDEPFATLRNPSASVSVYADSMDARSSKRGVAGPGGLRGACSGFSDTSRRRLIKTLSRVRVAGMVSYFITLTYPRSWPGDWHIWKHHLKVWRDRLMYNYPEIAGGVWRVEFQKRGAPHFHLIVWSTSDLPALERVNFAQVLAEFNRRNITKSNGDKFDFWSLENESLDFRLWLSRSWYEVVDSGERAHITAGTKLQRLDGRSAVRLYVSKYVAKMPDGLQPDGWGRNWGLFSRKDVNGDKMIDTGAVLECEITDSEFVLIRRIMRQWIVHRGVSERFVDKLRRMESISMLGFGVESAHSDSTGPPAVVALLRGCVPSVAARFAEFLAGY